MATHEQIVSAYENYLAENESFETKSIKAAAARARKALGEDRKTTRLNSSHKPISYAVFCLKKKKQLHHP